MVKAHPKKLTLNADEPFNRLQEDADAQSQKKDTIKERTEKTGPLPAKGKCSR